MFCSGVDQEQGWDMHPKQSSNFPHNLGFGYQLKLLLCVMKVGLKEETLSIKNPKVISERLSFCVARSD